MEGWEDILKARFDGEQVPLPEGDWEWFESNMLIPRLRRRRLGKIAACAGALMAAASIALFVLPVNREPSPVIDDGARVIMMENNFVADNSEAPSVPVAPTVPKVNSVPGHAEADGVPEVPAAQEIPEAYEASEVSEAPEVPEVPEAPKVAEKVENQEVIEPWTESGDFETDKRIGRRRVSVSPRIGGIGSRHLDNTVIGTVSSIRPASGMINPSATYFSGAAGTQTSTHYIPVSFSLDVSVPLSPRLAITTGAELSYYCSRATGVVEMRQNAFFLGIPLRLDWTITRSGPMSVYAGAGFKVDRLIHVQRTEDYDVSPNPFHRSVKIKDNRLNWSAIGDIGLQYNLSERVGLYVSPEVSYYFRPADPVITTYRNENPFMLSVSLGMKFDL